MTTAVNAVAPLNKVSISLAAGRANGRSDLTPEPISITFVYGIGKEGLTPFEYELSGISSGGSTQFHLARHEVDAFFEHLDLPLPATDAEEIIYFTARVDHVSPASSREVIKAMAEVSGSCSCGCGCGGGMSHEGCEEGSCGNHP